MCVGVQRQANNAQAFDYMKSHKARWIELENARTANRDEQIDGFIELVRQSNATIMLTVDLDGIRQSDAPGVSAPSSIGLTADEVLQIVRRFGVRHATSLDVSEYNPLYDRDDQTAHLAALIVYQIITGKLAANRD